MNLFLYGITNTIFASPHTFSTHSYCLQTVCNKQYHSLGLSLITILSASHSPVLPQMHALRFWCHRFSNGLSCWWCSVSPRIIKCFPAFPLHPCWFYSHDLQHLRPAFPKLMPYLPTEIIRLGWSPFRRTLSKNGEVVKLKWESINKELKDSIIINVTPYRFLQNMSCQKKSNFISWWNYRFDW